MNNLVFKNPAARARKELFGGAVKIGSQVFLLGHRPYTIFQGFMHWESYENIAAKIGTELLEEFLEKKLFLTIDATEAQRILGEKGGER